MTYLDSAQIPPPPSVRAPRAAGDDTRQRAIRAALLAFAADGFTAVTTRQLAATAGINIATLNYHFGSKQGVYDAVVAQVYARLQERGTALLEQLPGATVETIVEAAYVAAREESEGVRILLREVLDHGGLRDQTRAAYFLPSLEQFAPLVGAHLKTSPAQARNLLVTLGFLVARFAVQSSESLQEAFGLESPAATHDAVVRSLTVTASALASA